MAHSLEELVAKREAVLLARQAERIADIPQPTLVQLALAPVWTPALADGAGILEPKAARSTLQRLSEEGWLAYAPAAPGEPVESERYWMTPGSRTRVLLDAREGPTPLSLVPEINRVARSILELRKKGAAVPRLTERWAELASRADGIHGAADTLDDQVRTRLENGDSGGALRWIEAALPLADILGGELSLAVARSGRRIELSHRRRHDRRQLRRFLLRPALLRAFEQLIGPDDERWALHFVGAGGVGKTMMMRYISSELVPRLGGSSGRVDFDYLNPDYPGRAPALLLAALAEELLLHDRTGAAGRLFERFASKRGALEERLRDAPLAAQPVGVTLESAEFNEVLHSFADAVDHLPKPVVLLLDTCEELSKIRQDGTVPATVQATFEILKRLHDDVLPQIRVVFSGRRPLASRGAGWSAIGSPQVGRPYLRLHEIRGFSQDEAERFLREKMETRDELIEAVMERSDDSQDPVRFKWDDPTEAPAPVKRYSPFELKLYAEWVKDDAGEATASILAGDPHRYIEMRIAGRIDHPGLRRLLPAVGLLGRFDYDTLRATTEMDDATFHVVIEELADQEWVERQANEFLAVDRGLRPKLLAYCRSRDPSAVENARRAAGEHLRKATLERDLRELDLSHFEACLRLLGVDLVAATDWWRAVEERFAREQAYDWARGMLYRIIDQRSAALESERETDPIDPALLASVLATYAATFVHTSPQADLDTWWADVERAAEAHPLADERARLLQRAFAGRVAGACHAGRDPGAAALDALTSIVELRRPDAQVAASVIAALEALIEREEPREPSDEHVLSIVSQLASAIAEQAEPPELRAYATVIAARVDRLRLVGEFILVNGAIRQAQGVIPGRQGWLDWRAPEDVESRIRLEALRIACHWRPPHVVLDWAREWPLPSHPDWPPVPLQPSTDAERLTSALLLVQRAVRTVIAPESWKLTRDRVVELTAAAAEPSCNAHRMVPPLLTVWAEEEASVGRIGDALELLQTGARTTEQASTSAAAVRAAELAAARIILRMRLEDTGRRASLAPSEPESADLRWLLDGLHGLRDAQFADPNSIAGSIGGFDDPQWLHVRWRTLYGLDPGRGLAALEWATSARFPAGETFPAFSCHLDQIEANQLAKRLGRSAPFPGLEVAHVGFDRWVLVVRDAACAWRLHVRASALGDRRPTHPPSDGLGLELGPRQMAQIELDEGEALSLRLPSQARSLFEDARVRFEECGDQVGALLAAIAEALVLVRIGDRASLMVLLEQRVKLILERIPLPLPSWERIRLIATEGTPEQLDDIAPPEWRPWLARLVACAAWRLCAAGEKHGVPAVEVWLESSYAGAVGQRQLLPAELGGLLGQSARVRSARLSRRGTFRYAAPWVALIAAFFALTALAGAEPASSSALTWIGLGIVVIALLAIPLYWREFRAAASSSRTRVLSVHASPGQALQALEPVASVTVALTGKRGREQADSGTTTVAVGASYRDAAAELPESLVLALQKIAKHTGFRTAPLELHVDRRAAAVCWEGLLSHAATGVERPRDIPFRFRRICDVVPLQSGTEWRRIRNIVSFTALPHEEAMARSGWSKLPRRFKTEIAPAAMLRVRAEATPPVHVVHLVTGAIETASGVRLELEAPGTVVKDFSATPRGELLRADELPVLFPRAGLYVLQSRPMQSSVRTRAEREQAALLRAFAAELSELGVPAVVTVPPFVPATAALVVAQVAGALRRYYTAAMMREGYPSLRPWMLRVRSAQISLPYAVRTIERKTLKGSRELDLEAVFDLCVYTNGWSAGKRGRFIFRLPKVEPRSKRK
jgi:hypothetical protein